MIVFSEIKRCQLPHSTQFFQKAIFARQAAERLRHTGFGLPAAEAPAAAAMVGGGCTLNKLDQISKLLVKFYKILQIFGGLVLGCIKTKFCKKICV